MALSAPGQPIAVTASDDRSVRFCNLISLGPSRSALMDHVDWVEEIALAGPAGRVNSVLVVDRRHVTSWSVEDTADRLVHRMTNSGVTCSAATWIGKAEGRGGPFFALGDRAGVVRSVDERGDDRPILEFSGPVTAAEFVPDRAGGVAVIAGALDGQIQRWSTGQGRRSRAIDVGSPVEHLAVWPCGEGAVLVVTADGAFHLLGGA
jgi:hypothetical protein